ncbi:TPA: hypothetical protein ACT2IM_001049 [Streptococcus suis]
MEKDIELLTELKGQFVEAMVVESKKLLFNGSVLDKYGEYIRALSNAIKMMKEAKMIPKIESCEECGCKYVDGTTDYDSIFQTGYCGDCLVERVERGEEW